MKKIALLVTAIIAVSTTYAQVDSSTNKVDTIKVGNYYIIKKTNSNANNNDGYNKKSDRKIDITINFNKNSKPKNKNLQTNWWIMDLGFANVIDNTNYTQAQAGNYLKVIRPANGMVNSQSMELTATKSSNVNIWFFMQKLNISQNKLNLKYGLGYEMFNLRYERNVSYRKSPQNFVFNDSIGFSKNKLFTGYLTAPLMLNYTANPQNKKSFSVSAGLSIGYLLSGVNKQISSERGKQKTKGNLELEPFKLTAIGELGLGAVRLYGSYSLTNMFKDGTRLSQYPFAIGVRFSNW